MQGWLPQKNGEKNPFPEKESFRVLRPFFYYTLYTVSARGTMIQKEGAKHPL